MSIDGMAAAAKLRSFDISGRTGACLHWVWEAYDAAGADVTRSAHTALQAWYLSDGKHTDHNPPPGVPVWLGRRSDGNLDGDVVISLGGGKVIATDQPAWGRVGVCTIAERMALTRRVYLGWTECIFDAPIKLPTPAGGPAKPAPTIPSRRKDLDMPVLSVIPGKDRKDDPTSPNGKKNLYFLAGDNGLIMQWTGEAYARAIEKQVGGAAAVCSESIRLQLLKRFAQVDVAIVNADDIGA